MLTFGDRKFPKSAYVRNRESIKLQLTFCERMSKITDTCLADTLAKYSEMLFLLRIGNTENEIWKNFIEDLEKGGDEMAVIMKSIGKRKREPRYTRVNCVGEFAFNINR